MKNIFDKFYSPGKLNFCWPINMHKLEIIWIDFRHPKQVLFEFVRFLAGAKIWEPKSHENFELFSDFCLKLENYAPYRKFHSYQNERA